MKSRLIVFAMMMIAMSPAWAGKEMVMENYTGSAEFERLKSLEGSWEGTAEHFGKTDPAVIEYKITSAGSAIVETFHPGSEQEMISVYYEKDGKTLMTHYCALKNQPRFQLQDRGQEAIHFKYAKTPGINPKKDAHMHDLVVSFDGADAFVQEWTFYENGKPGGTSIMRLSRVK